ncbi:MAG TPA: helix-turn-helix transcriptional regulator [Chitinophagaceae bacterium]|nr:helix-turn-helix transcriptional regulator [Chitinophagaceae bacterium]
MFTYKIHPATTRTSSSLQQNGHEEPAFIISELDTDAGNCLPASLTQKNQLPHTILWIGRGTGELLIDLETYALSPNSFFYLEPGQLYRFSAAANVQGHCISFSGSFLQSSEIFLRLCGNTGAVGRYFYARVEDDNLTNELQLIVEEMKNEAGNSCPLKVEVLRGLLGVLMVQLARKGQAGNTMPRLRPDEQIAKKFKELLSTKCHGSKMVSEYASELAISANYLNQVIKRCTGHTASQHIRQHTILEAQKRAVHFGTNMKEIAYHLGFDDLAHFSKFFKKNAGTSFRNFRNSSLIHGRVA